MTLSIVIPVYNEKNLLPKILYKLIQETPNINKEFIIVDDCSNDGTEKWLTKLKKFNYLNLKNKKLNFLKVKKNKNLKIFLKNKNEGKGSAVKIGLKNTSNNIIVIQDADLEYFPSDLNKMISFIRKNKCEIVFGNRFSRKKKNIYHYFFYAIGNFFLSAYTSMLFNTKLSDIAVCYKMFKKEVINELDFDCNDFMFDFEFTSKILKKKKWRVLETNILYKGRTFEQGKKISWIDGFRALLIITKIKIFS